MSKSRLSCSVLLACACLLAAPPASAYCIATTCDRGSVDCATDEHDCNVEGVPLYWDQGKVDLDVASEGSALRAITGEQALDAAKKAFAAWQDATCDGGGHPSLDIVTRLKDDVTVEHDDGANVLAFFDDTWPFDSDAIAKTGLGFYKGSGKLYEADVAVDSKDFAFSVGDEDTKLNDLQAVLTHELGHVLGLDHSDVPGSTMQAKAEGSASPELRSLEQDDIDAICSVYPPGKPPGGSGEPDGEASGSDGGCSLTRPAPARTVSSLAFISLGGVLVTWQRRRARRSRR